MKSRVIVKADHYEPVTKEVDATPVKLVTAEGLITETMVPDTSVLLGEKGMAMPRDPQYIMGPNPLDEGNEICYNIARVLRPAQYADFDPNLLIQPEAWVNDVLNGRAYCGGCREVREQTGFRLEVPEGWPFNALMQCRVCGGINIYLLGQANHD